MKNKVSDKLIEGINKAINSSKHLAWMLKFVMDTQEKSVQCMALGIPEQSLPKILNAINEVAISSTNPSTDIVLSLLDMAIEAVKEGKSVDEIIEAIRNVH